jgi:hypothetical protein
MCTAEFAERGPACGEAAGGKDRSKSQHLDLKPVWVTVAAA